MRGGLDHGRRQGRHLLKLRLTNGSVPAERFIGQPPWRADVDFAGDTLVRGTRPKIIPFDLEVRTELKHPQDVNVDAALEPFDEARNVGFVAPHAGEDLERQVEVDPADDGKPGSAVEAHAQSERVRAFGSIDELQTDSRKQLNLENPEIAADVQGEPTRRVVDVADGQGRW